MLQSIAFVVKCSNIQIKMKVKINVRILLNIFIFVRDEETMFSKLKIPSEMEVTPRYTLLTLFALFTLLTLFTVFKTILNCLNSSMYLHILFGKERFWNGLMGCLSKSVSGLDG